MRRQALLCILVLVAAACGGDDDTGSSAAEPGVIRSDDGAAVLTLPDGVDGDGISVEAVEVEGAAAAYELLPAGTTFDEPATLTISGLDVPDPLGPALAILESDDREPELVEGVTTTVGEDATVVVPVAHFSTLTLGFWFAEHQTEVSIDSHVADFGSPARAVVQQPFDVPVQIAELGRRVEFDIPWDTSMFVEVQRTRARGSITASNALPAVARNLPPYGEVGASYRGSAAFRCTSAGTAVLTYTVDFQFDLTFGRTIAFDETPFERTASLVIERNTRCTAATSTSSTSSTSTTSTTIDEAALKPVVTEITIDLQRPVTTYSATARAAEGAYIDSYVWRMIGEDCGTPKTPWEQVGQSVTWSHADTPPDSCPHSTEDHTVTVSLTVTDELGVSTVCTFEGSASRVLTDPPCN